MNSDSKITKGIESVKIKRRNSNTNMFTSAYKILIVDDQGFNIDAMKIILKYSVGLDVEKFCEQSLTGKGCLEMIKNDIESKKVRG